MLTSDIKDKLEFDPESMMSPNKTSCAILADSKRRMMKLVERYKCISNQGTPRTISSIRGQLIESDKYASNLSKKLDEMESMQKDMVNSLTCQRDALV